LARLHEVGIFDSGHLVIKGGTALRKFRAGNAGRFSTDLDFAVGTQGLEEYVLEALDNIAVDGFQFRIEVLVPGRRARLHVDTPLGTPTIPARIDLSPKQAWLRPERMDLVPLPIHARYDVIVPPTPVMQVSEVIAEKLARYRRASLARDLYDLYWLAGRPLDEPLVRRLWLLKCYIDIVEDSLGNAPINPLDVLQPRSSQQFDEEAIGFLTHPVDIALWERTVRERYGFLADLEQDETQWAQVNRRNHYEIQQVIAALGNGV
ncbi:MAG: nucleotidyl transferase AbiEii/AbiGii toxin family protein, partial [Acidiferrobacterales bacterium]